jgi:uncharacterized membrane protein
VARIDRTIEVDVPVSTAFNQWTQFEDYPRFMEKVLEVREESDKRLFWRTEFDGHPREWRARITRLVPDEVLAWESEDAPANSGIVLFKPLDDERAEIQMRLEYDPQDFKEHVAGGLGPVSRRVEGDLQRFKELIEQQGVETGAWRGEIIQGRERPVAPLYDSKDAPEDDQIRPDITPL